MNKPLIVIGNGGHAAVLTEILIAQGQDIIGFTAPQEEYNRFGLNYLGTDQIIAQYATEKVELVLGIGMLKPSSLREKVFKVLKEKGYRFKSVIHPSTIIAPSAILGEGVQLMAGVIIQTATVIADNTIINTSAMIDHDGMIGAHVHIAPGTKISGAVRIGNSTHIGTGTIIIQGIRIGENCLIGAGSVVVKNMNSNIKAYGVPAKEVKSIE
ncbi:acetyltransferase [Metasolibacillus fluoroglycofenilyticus]|uniref:acetyltransferase n=1 Tax=Metasolibacillus fluoroglycofenilyticus TaxID=1239396 RepID=UPI000D347A01|nr:acetyltransferase [Metasolibacillus fluoroglycofenilyticus]